MSRERALRRAARLAETERAVVARARSQRRRARLRVLRHSVRPRLRGGRTGRLYPRRTRAQRIGIAIVALALLGYIWLEIDSLPTRIALTALVVVGSPALIVITLDRRI